ncbi:DinG family ATP-dependent helicase YoaA [Vibrio maritimus]|uniref:DinG family ATP-dependent helicase YoaA n=2 Tax=Vibrio TaxID=662 RepID=A0A090S4L3_9VIBR|nr:DinG family ATP-dependent helicase YoaA [Vibrio maritimus]GAL23635.1 DinG family ATP-dependent helicase YoaA [Vibrio variabilis]
MIRDQKDRGALIICDNRLVTRDYGATFLSSLPPIPRTRDLGVIKTFLAQGEAPSAAEEQIEK